MTFRDRIVQRLFGARIAALVTRHVSLAVRALDDPRDTSVSASTYPRDRYPYDREEVLRDALDAWRVNPLARRVVALTSQYVVGGGLEISSDHQPTHDFLQEWWNHPLNRMPVRAFEWCDELTRSGNLFPLLSTGPDGMTYLRALPAADIQSIQSRPNDVEQGISFLPRPSAEDPDPPPWPAYDPQNDDPTKSVVLHYAINRPIGAQWGESDLAPITRWLSRYASWLEDRVRLNRFRFAFMYVVRGLFPSAADRLERQAELNANPPNPGSILVADQTEEWDVIHPKLDTFEAERDGLTIKKMLAAGSGTPLHFLAEPEGSTRTTAEQAGGPTYRHYEQRQLFFTWLLADIARAVCRRRSAIVADTDPDSNIRVIGGDISPRDNAALATAGTTMMGAAVGLRDREIIDDEELLRLCYKFTGEQIDVPEMIARGKKAGPPKVYARASAPEPQTPQPTTTPPAPGQRVKVPENGKEPA